MSINSITATVNALIREKIWLAVRREGGYYLSRLGNWALIGLVVFLGWKFIPVYVSALRFEYAIDQYVRHSASVGLSAREVQDYVLWKARHLELPVRAQDVTVEVHSKQQTVAARVAYRVPVNLLLHQVVLKFHVDARDQGLFSGEDLKRARKSLEKLR